MSVSSNNLYSIYRKYSSTDSGETWTPLNEYGYFLKEESAAQCVPPTPEYKARLTLFGGSTVDIPWNGTTAIRSNETRGYSGNTVSVEISNGVTEIGGEGEGVTYKGSFAYYYYMSSVTIPDTVTSIGDYAFSVCKSLSSITIPSGVTTIGEFAFDQTSGLTSIFIPNSVTSIGQYAFRHCSGLTSVNIPSGVTSIGDYTFQGCTSLTSLTIPDSVISIGSGVCQNCSGLTSVTLGNSITSIGGWAFFGCSALTSVNIPSGVTMIEYNTFCQCSGITSVIIPSGVTDIDNGAFSSCVSLSSITCYATTAPSINNNTFTNHSPTGTIYVPTGATGYNTWLSKLGSGWSISYI